jgi:N-acetylglucosaminyldiphosphoundecaprenol N-acetyl-beta-D-mannosaminyltransferase
MDKELLDEGLRASEILGVFVNHLDYEEACDKIIKLALDRKSSYVCIANVSSVVEANYNIRFREIINGSDLVTADGMPLAWGLRFQGARKQKRISGTELTHLICEKSEQSGILVGFYGATEETLQSMSENLKNKYPLLNIVYKFSPPFRDLAEKEDAGIINQINNSGLKILFVGLGCPKQEIWMASHKNKISAVMIGIGAAFDFISGSKKRSPVWMQNLGLEWFYRLVIEPKRLWKRYLVGNTIFFWLVFKKAVKCIIPF